MNGVAKLPFDHAMAILQFPEPGHEIHAHIRGTLRETPFDEIERRIRTGGDIPAVFAVSRAESDGSTDA